MGFELKTNMTIHTMKLYVKEKEGRRLRRCKLKLQAPFSEDIAAALGDDAKKARKALENHGLEKAVMNIDRLVLDGTLALPRGGEQADLKGMAGTKATGKAGTDGDDTDEGEGTPPIITLEFDITYDREAHVFFGDHYGDEIEVSLTDVQKSLPGTEAPNVLKAEKNGHTNGHAAAANGHTNGKGKGKKAKKLKVVDEADNDLPPSPPAGADGADDMWTS